MTAGMSKAKARRASKSKANGMSRARAGLPAKAGKRRPHNIVKDQHGNYVAAPFKDYAKAEEPEVKMWEMPEGRSPITVPKDLLWKAERIINSKSGADPFLKDRLRTHLSLGLISDIKELEAA